jgi:hypothetical protein
MMRPFHDVWPAGLARRPLDPATRLDPFGLVGFIGVLMILAGFLLVLVGRGPGDPGTGTLQGSASGRPPPGFDPPRALPANGEFVRSRVLASGDLEVDHWIRSTYPIYVLTLRVPPAVQRAEPGTLVARHLRVLSDGVAQYGPSRVGTRRQSYHPHGASTLKVSYVLSGALVRRGSAPGRALLRATSLDLTYSLDRGPRVVIVRGARVLAAACLPPNGSSTASARPCGTAVGRAWRVSLDPRARHETVLAQVDLS